MNDENVLPDEDNRPVSLTDVRDAFEDEMIYAGWKDATDMSDEEYNALIEGDQP